MTKKYTVKVTRQAFEQLEEIKQYISVELASPDTAKELMNQLRETIASLELLPKRFGLIKDEEWRAKGVRRTAVKNFIIYYWIDEEKQQVYVIAVVFGKREQLEQLKLVNMQ